VQRDADGPRVHLEAVVGGRRLPVGLRPANAEQLRGAEAQLSRHAHGAQHQRKRTSGDI
jgi:hypothetical protein